MDHKANIPGGFLLFIIIAGTALGASTVRTMSMEPGNSMTVEFPSGSEIKVSRKGVVDVFAVSETSWQLTALRGGLVIIDAIDGSTGTPYLPRLFIDVRGASTSERQPVAVGLPDWLCKRPGLTCDVDAGIIEGGTSDYKWLMRAQAWCNNSRNCHLFVDLTSEARQEQQFFIESKVGPDFQVTSSKSGQITVSATCDPTTAEQHTRIIEALLPRLIEDKILLFTCESAQNMFKVRVKAKKVSRSEGTVTGFAAELKQTTKTPPLSGTLAATSSLRDEKVMATGETIGEPSFLATENVEFQTLIGGELPFISEGEKAGIYNWKEYGLSIKGKIRGTRNNKIRSSIELFLKSVNDQPTMGLSTSSLKSNIEAKESVWTLVGELDLNSVRELQKLSPMLSGVPIIGPLFRLSDSANSTSQLQVWINIEKQVDSEDSGPQF